MKRIVSFLTQAHIRLLNNQRGATLIEYVLVVAAVAAAAATLIGGTAQADSVIGKIATKIGDIHL